MVDMTQFAVDGWTDREFWFGELGGVEADWPGYCEEFAARLEAAREASDRAIVLLGDALERGGDYETLTRISWRVAEATGFYGGRAVIEGGGAQ